MFHIPKLDQSGQPWYAEQASYGSGYLELFHDGELVYRTGEHMNMYPWLFDQRLVPEPNAAMGLAVGIFWIVCCRRRFKKRSLA